MLFFTDFKPKGTISEVRVHAGLYLDILDADRSPNAVRVHAENTQVDFEVDRQAATFRFPTKKSFDRHGKFDHLFCCFEPLSRHLTVRIL